MAMSTTVVGIIVINTGCGVVVIVSSHIDDSGGGGGCINGAGHCYWWPCG